MVYQRALDRGFGRVRVGSNLVFAANYTTLRAKTIWFEIRMIYMSGATYLSNGCCCSEPAL